MPNTILMSFLLPDSDQNNSRFGHAKRECSLRSIHFRFQTAKSRPHDTELFFWSNYCRPIAPQNYRKYRCCHPIQCFVLLLTTGRRPYWPHRPTVAYCAQFLLNKNKKVTEFSFPPNLAAIARISSLHLTTRLSVSCTKALWQHWKWTRLLAYGLS